MGITKMVGSMIKKKTAAPKAEDTVKPGEICAVLDYPQQGEKITAPHYTFRVGTIGDISRVEISLNDGPWQACRNAAGYWWYDWSGYTAGRYQLAVRAQTIDNQEFTSEPCKFQVALATEAKQPKTPRAKP